MNLSHLRLNQNCDTTTMCLASNRRHTLIHTNKRKNEQNEQRQKLNRKMNKINIHRPKHRQKIHDDNDDDDDFIFKERMKEKIEFFFFRSV